MLAKAYLDTQHPGAHAPKPSSPPKSADNICLMELYGQDAEARLLSRLIAHLDQRILIDVGAERGDLAQGLLGAGVDELHAIDPHPDNSNALRSRFDADARVKVHEYAVSDGDGVGELRVSSTPDGAPLPFGHTLLERPDTDEIAWKHTITVRRRSLASLIDAGEVPHRLGILKVDTEGHDLAVVRGMGSLEADVVMVEHWTDLPHGLGVCPWTANEMVTALGARGFHHFAFIVHRGEFVTMKWDDGSVEPGVMGNLVFIHDRSLARLLPDLLEFAGELAETVVRTGQDYAKVADDRQALVNRLKAATDDRQAEIDQLKQAADDRLALINELHGIAETRLQALEATSAQLEARDAELQTLRHQSV
jgi:FkbM family methyltransferase